MRKNAGCASVGSLKMRFAFISTMVGLPWGGSEELWSQAALRLQERGHQISASVAWWPQLSPKVTGLSKRGIDVCVRVPDVRPSLALRAWKRLTRRRQSEPKELAWLRSQKADLTVISQGGNADGLGFMDFCRETNLPFVAVVQCNNENWWPPDKISEELARAYRAARKVFCVSRHNLDLLESQIGEALPNAEVVWNPVTVPVDAPPVFPKINGVWKVACVARLEPAAKGQDLLFQVLSQSKWRERPLEVNLYGAGPCEQRLKVLADRLRLKNVFFRGHASDVRKIWDDNQLLVLPSRYEGLPLALVEAMWCARPAVVTDIGGNAEVCLDGETGFVAAAPVIRLLDEAFERAWNGRHEWAQMGRAARARAEQLVPKDAAGAFCERLVHLAEPNHGRDIGHHLHA